MATDAEGREVPPDEPMGVEIDVWEVHPHPQSRARFDYMAERSWQQMLSTVKGSLDSFLEQFSDEELREGVTMTFKLVKMPKCDYEEIVADE